LPGTVERGGGLASRKRGRKSDNSYFSKLPRALPGLLAAIKFRGLRNRKSFQGWSEHQWEKPNAGAGTAPGSNHKGQTFKRKGGETSSQSIARLGKELARGGRETVVVRGVRTGHQRKRGKKKQPYQIRKGNKNLGIKSPPSSTGEEREEMSHCGKKREKSIPGHSKKMG